MIRALFLLAACLSLWPQSTPQAPPKGAISGLVVDAVTGQPIAGATVTLARLGSVRIPGLPPAAASQPAVPRVVTDSRGRFVYANLDPGDDYYLGARMSGYEYTRYGWSGPGQSLVIDDIYRIAVAPGGWVANIRIPLWRLPVIGGRVVDERGEPVVGVAVRAFSQAILGGYSRLVGSNVATTDDRGVYRITGAPPGRYVVSVLSVQSTVLAATPEGPINLRATVGQLQTGGIGAGGPALIGGPGVDLDSRHRLALTNFATPPPPSSTPTRAYAAQFYPGVGTVDEATAIEVGFGEATLGIDFQLVPVPAVRVSGRVLGVSSPGMLLRLMPAGGEGLSFGSEAATTILEADKTFVFFNVPAGRYTLIATTAVIDFTTGSPSTRLPEAPGFAGGGASVGSRNGTPNLSYLARYGAPAPSWGRVPVMVGSADIDNLALPMLPVGRVSGRLVFEPGTVVPQNARLRVRAEPANGDPSLGAVSGPASSIDGAYSFVIEGLLGGTYLLDVGDYSVKSILAGGREVSLSGIDAASSPDTTDVVITLTDKKQEIRGTVAAPPGKIAGVIAFPANRDLWINYGWDAAHFATARTNSNGSFRLRPAVAGEYCVIAVDVSQIDSWTDQKFLAAATSLATRLSLGWGETKTLDLAWRDVVIK